MAAFLRPTWWLAPPLIITALALFASLRASQQAGEVRYDGPTLGTFFDHPLSVEEFAAPYRYTYTDAIMEKLYPSPGFTPEQRRTEKQRLQAQADRDVAAAPQRRTAAIQKHDAEASELRDISSTLLMIGVAALVLALPFQWVMRKLTPQIGRLLGGLDRAQQGSSPTGPQARLTFKDGRSYSRTTVYTLATLGVLSIPAGVLLILFVAGQPNGAGNIVPLLLGGVLILGGMIGAPFQLHWVVLINRAQRALDSDIAFRRQTAENFHRQAAQGSAAFQTGFAPAANLPAARPAPAQAAPPKPSIAEDQFRIDLPPPSQSKTP